MARRDRSGLVAADLRQFVGAGANWHEKAERARALREEHDQAIVRSSEMARQRAERETAEAEERARAKQMARTGLKSNRSGVCPRGWVHGPPRISEVGR